MIQGPGGWSMIGRKIYPGLSEKVDFGLRPEGYKAVMHLYLCVVKVMVRFGGMVKEEL